MAALTPGLQSTRRTSSLNSAFSATLAAGTLSNAASSSVAYLQQPAGQSEMASQSVLERVPCCLPSW
jgi:hypothetical protein